MEELITVYLMGEATPEQAMELEDWKAEHPENERMFHSLEKVYALTHGTAVFQTPDKHATLQKIKDVRTSKTGRVLRFNFRLIASAAAVAVIAFLLGILWNQKVDTGKGQAKTIPDSETVETKELIIRASDRVTSFTLEDSSKVSLTTGSQLTLSAHFNKSERRSALKGSGTFEVIHNDRKPFVIEVEDLEVVDIGTVFTIDRKEDTVKVIVREGAVELRLNNRVLEVSEGDSAFYVISDKIFSRYKTSKHRQENVFVFEGTRLKEVASVLSNFFNRKIVVIDESIADCPLSVTFKNEDLATILDVIKELLDVKIVQNKDLIGIYGEGCN